MSNTDEFYLQGIDPKAVHESVTRSLMGAAFRVGINEPWPVKYLTGSFKLNFGYSPADFIGDGKRTLLSLVHPEDRARFRNDITSTARTGEAAITILRVLHRDGSVRWIQTHTQQALGDSGEVEFLDGYVLDITNIKKAETDARRAWISLSQTPDEVYWCDADGRFIYANAAALRNLGYLQDELVHMHVFDIAPNRKKEEWRLFWQRLSERGHAQYETRHKAKNGRTYPVDLTTTLVSFEGQEFAFASAHDISARKRNEAALRASEETAQGAYREIKKLRDQLESENIYLREEIDKETSHKHIVGQSEAILATLRQIKLVAPTDSTVLLLGESGTGKELVAREIHQRSMRQAGPMIRVNCASIPEELYESEFFGHVKGAFTGAVQDRAGRFELANGGTIFLDEIGEIPLVLQSKLLRVLQEGQYERVGEGVTRSVDVRVIAATNRDLKQEVERGRFRNDLYYRVNVFPMELVPLRKRAEDIPLLVAHLLPAIAQRINRPVPRLTHANINALSAYHWPGNVRELQNVLERAVITCRGRFLTFDLPEIAHRSTDHKGQAAATVGPGATHFLTEAAIRQRERENTRTVLEMTGWRVFGADGAAELLGIKPTTLLSRIKKMKLEKPRSRP